MYVCIMHYMYLHMYVKYFSAWVILIFSTKNHSTKWFLEMDFPLSRRPSSTSPSSPSLSPPRRQIFLRSIIVARNLSSCGITTVANRGVRSKESIVKVEQWLTQPMDGLQRDNYFSRKGTIICFLTRLMSFHNESGMISVLELRTVYYLLSN